MPPRTYFAGATVGGVEIVLKSLSPSELFLAAKLGGEDRADEEALRQALVKVGGKDITPRDMLGSEAVERLLPGPAFFQALAAYKRMTEPRAAHIDHVLHYMEVEDGPDGRQHVVMLPETRLGLPEAFRRVVLRPQTRVKVRDAIARAKKSARSPQAQEIQAGMLCLRDCVVQVEERTWPQGAMVEADLNELFTAADLLLLYAAWMEIHTGAQEEAGGNLRAVPTPS